jgi:hypothetical protein
MAECCVCLHDVLAKDLLLVYPCGHRCMCDACAAMLEARPLEKRLCPKCRAPLRHTMRVFDS